jgi:hypothetical protein
MTLSSRQRLKLNQIGCFVQVYMLFICMVKSISLDIIYKLNVTTTSHILIQIHKTPLVPSVLTAAL